MSRYSSDHDIAVCTGRGAFAMTISSLSSSEAEELDETPAAVKHAAQHDIRTSCGD
jgi:hypothetical protein